MMLTSCSNKSNKIVVAEVTRSIFYAPLYVSLNEGYFKQEGLNTPMFPICENPLTFDIRSICDMIEQNRSEIK